MRLLALTFPALIALAAGAAELPKWEPIGISGGGAMFTPAISPADPKLMMIDCDMSASYVSSDGGQNWNPQASNTSDPLYWITFVDSLHGWACGYSGVIVATMTKSKSFAVSFAAASAAVAACAASAEVGSSAAAIRRSTMPVRVRIHSSLVSTIFSKSWFVITRGGAAAPTPRRATKLSRPCASWSRNPRSGLSAGSASG